MPSLKLLFFKFRRIKTMISLLVFLVLVAVVFISLSQLQVVRQFLSQATGKKASITIDAQKVVGPMPRPWLYLAQGGEESSWRLQPIADKVKVLQPRYIRIDHIYDFYEIVQGSPGNLSFNFSKFDQIIDDILATGAKPYIALSYMPPTISSGDIVSLPQRWEDWQLTVQKTVEHVSGTRKIADVYYEVWNEPDLFGGFKYYGDKSYLTLYTYAVQGANQAKGVLPFKIGGPATTGLYKNWFDALVKHVSKNNLRLDFISWHCYSHSLDKYEEDLANANQWLAAYPGLSHTVELNITEWGHDSEVHPGYDADYGAAHTVAGAILMTDLLKKAFIFEIQDGKGPNNQEYWGRWGLLTHQDFGSKTKKRYQALKLLNQISDQRLTLIGQGSWVKALAARNPQGGIDLVMANSDQFSQNVETVPITIVNLADGNYRIQIQYLDGRTQSQTAIAAQGKLETSILMTANTVAFIKISI